VSAHRIGHGEPDLGRLTVGEPPSLGLPDDLLLVVPAVDDRQQGGSAPDRRWAAASPVPRPEVKNRIR
jgi:hypothetical protein